MDRPWLLTRSSWTDLKIDWMMPKEDGLKSCRTSFGHIGQHLESPLERPPSQWRMGSSAFTSDGNNELLKKNLDLIEERRENAMVQLAYYQHKLKQGYNMNVKLRPLAPKDLVLRKVVGNTKNPAWGKLGPNWEWPYRIKSVAGVGAYYLEDLNERVVLHPWNVNNLKMYYYW